MRKGLISAMALLFLFSLAQTAQAMSYRYIASGSWSYSSSGNSGGHSAPVTGEIFFSDGQMPGRVISYGVENWSLDLSGDAYSGSSGQMLMTPDSSQDLPTYYNAESFWFGNDSYRFQSLEDLAFTTYFDEQLDPPDLMPWSRMILLGGQGERIFLHDFVLEKAPVPEPSTIMLMGLGLFGLAGYGRKKMKK